MTDLQQLLAQIEHLDHVSTQGPWEYDGSTIDSKTTFDEIVTTEVTCSTYCYGGTGIGVQDDNDAEFIAISRTALPKLAKALGAVEQECRRMAVESSGSSDMWDNGRRAAINQIRQAITDALGGPNQ